MKNLPINAMGPLSVGDPFDPTSDESRKARRIFREHCKIVADQGSDNVSLDMFWGAIEPKRGVYNFDFIDFALDIVFDHNLGGILIDSAHKCGGNVGDNFNMPIPEHAWAETLANAILSDFVPRTVRDIRYVSELGNENLDAVACFATDFVMPLHRRRWQAILEHFADRADLIRELNVSLGPTGELRYPSYNHHDGDKAKYPTRGRLQFYSSMAIESFRAYVLTKYNGIEGVNKAWGTNLTVDEILPPSDPHEFFARRDHHNTQYGRDLFEWSNSSLLDSGRKILGGFFDVFAADDSPFKGTDIGAKIPGIHWMTGRKDGNHFEMGRRLPELSAGLIRSGDDGWHDDSRGHGYSHTLGMFKEFANRPDSRFVLHFTCLEMPDGEDKEHRANSVANSLVWWVGNEAKRQGIPVKGENAVWWNLPNAEAWERMRSHLAVPGSFGVYEGLTVLRMENIAEFPVAAEELGKTTAFVRDAFEVESAA